VIRGFLDSGGKGGRLHQSKMGSGGEGLGQSGGFEHPKTSRMALNERARWWRRLGRGGNPSKGSEIHGYVALAQQDGGEPGGGRGGGGKKIRWFPGHSIT